MWWSRKFAGPRTAAVIAVILGGWLSGCGFKPLYGNAKTSISAAELDTIQVAHLRDREGQILHTFLDQGFNPDGRRVKPRFDLRINLTKSIRNLGVRRDATATRANLSVTADFFLMEISTGKQRFSGKSSITVSYNILDDRFATVAAQENALERALRSIADSIKTRVSAHMTRGKTPA
jgi:LPS-assembly lipoprotein